MVRGLFMNTEEVYKQVMDIFDISARIAKDTKAFTVTEYNYREWRMSVLLIAKIVQEQYNNVLLEDEFEKEKEMLDKNKAMLEI